jgi:predicted SAM-dependent methyltransferase
MIKKITFQGQQYPEYEAQGNAAQYIIPMAKQYCKGYGYDIGAGKKEWAFPGATIIDPKLRRLGSDVDINVHKLWNHLFLPVKADYIFSSHCLEHLDSWINALDYWYTVIKDGGVIFLYLPHFNQKYWRPWNDKRHKHVLTDEIVAGYMIDKGYKEVITTGCDLMHSFAVVGIK